MKSRLSITIEKDYVDALQRASRQENRSLSNQIESILAQWLGNRKLTDEVPTTPGVFMGNFSRKRRMRTIEGRFLLDTNVLIYASLENDPRADRAREAIEFGRRADCEAYVSVQNLAEMYPNLTGPKTQPPIPPPRRARRSVAWQV